MTSVYKAAVLVVPVLGILLLLRACSQLGGESFQTEIAAVDESAELVFDDDALAVVASDRELAQSFREEALRFRQFLTNGHEDLVGGGRDRRLWIAIFSSPGKLQEYAGSTMPRDPRAGRFAAWHDPRRSAIFLPPDSDFRTLRHEMVHWVMSASFETAPIRSPWIGEGLAQYFEDGFDGLPKWDRTLRLGSIDWRRLVRLTHGEFVSAASIDRNYREALLLTGFLLATGRRDGLALYIEHDRRRGGSAPFFAATFRAAEPAFDRELRQYLAAPR